MKFTIVMTDDCNLRCSYCYEGGCKPKKYMNKDEIIEKMREKNTFFSQTEKVPLSVMQKFSMMNVSLDFTGCTFVYFNDEIIAVEEGDTTPY